MDFLTNSAKLENEVNIEIIPAIIAVFIIFIISLSFVS